LISQELSEFALHARAILGLPIPEIADYGPSASVAILAKGKGIPQFREVDTALIEPGTALRLFGKPSVDGSRRVAVTLARDVSIEAARAKARRAAAALKVDLI
jgi:phosphoribosylglycinamide formyltransferase 2